MTLRDQDVIPAVVEGEEVRVRNKVYVDERHSVHGEPGIGEEKASIHAGGTFPPFYVTHWVADELLREFDIDAKSEGAVVVDVEHEDVEVL